MNKLTISEIIEHCKRKTARYEQLNGVKELENADISDNFIKDYWEHRQVSEYLEELQQYKTTGTVEECREARERQRAKKPIMKPFYGDMEEEYLCCPNCGDILTDRIPVDNKDFYLHCLNCGQKFDWSDNE